MKKKVYTAVDVIDARRIVGELKKRGIEGYTRDGGPDDYVELNGISVYGKGIYVEAEDIEAAKDCLKEIEDINEAGIAGGLKAGTAPSGTAAQQNADRADDESVAYGMNNRKVKKRGKTSPEYDGEYEAAGGGAGKVIAVILLVAVIAVVVVAFAVR